MQKIPILNYNNVDIPFSLAEACDRGTFISGMPKSGKSNLAKILSEQLLKDGFVIRCFDCSKAHLEGAIPYYIPITADFEISRLQNIPYDKSVVYDLSRLYPEEQASFVGIILNYDWDIATTVGHMPIIYVLEEAQLVLPSGSLRAKYAQTTFRMVSVGRNYNERYIMITQRPADIDVKALSRVGQCYIGQHWEENDIRKLSHLLCLKYRETHEILSGLRLGEFIYFNPYDKICVKIHTPEYKSMRKPELVTPEFFHPKEKKSLRKRIVDFWIKN